MAIVQTNPLNGVWRLTVVVCMRFACSAVIVLATTGEVFMDVVM
jgi:hypothetical protein